MKTPTEIQLPIERNPATDEADDLRDIEAEIAKTWGPEIARWCVTMMDGWVPPSLRNSLRERQL
jgi:hypothetical protein